MPVLFGSRMDAPLSSACKMIKNMNKNYPIITDAAVSGGRDGSDIQTLKIKRLHAERAWKIKNIELKTAGNVTFPRANLVFEGLGTFRHEVDIPPHINAVRFYHKTLWKRNSGLRMKKSSSMPEG